MRWLLISLVALPSFAQKRVERPPQRDWDRLEVTVTACTFPEDRRGEPFVDVTARRRPLTRLVSVRTNFDDKLRESAELL